MRSKEKRRKAVQSFIDTFSPMFKESSISTSKKQAHRNLQSPKLKKSKNARDN